MGNSSSKNRPIWANIQPTQAIYQQNNGVYEQYLPSKGWLWNLFHPDKRRRERALREYWYTTPTLWQYPAAPTYPASVGYAQPGYVQQAYPAAQPLAPGPANMAAAAMMRTPTQMPIPEPAPPPGSFSPVIPDMDFAYGATPRSRSHGHRRRRRSSLSGSYSDDDSSLDYGSPLSDTLSDYSSDYSPRRRRHSHSYRSRSSHGHNPLPRPPRDVLTRTPYRNILQELPSTRAYY